MFTSEDSGLGCLATSRSLAERRSFRAASAGPKTFFTRRLLLAFLVLARALFAILSIYGCRWIIGRKSFSEPVFATKKKKVGTGRDAREGRKVWRCVAKLPPLRQLEL